MNVDSNGVKELNELNHRPPDEKKEVENWVAGYEESQEEDNSKVNGIPKDVRDVHGGSTEALAVLQMPQQQPQGPVVGWERFLHLRSLKVLLVENDDSTRHVVTALLRNCSYEVIQAAHGLQAWKIMEDLNNQIDLVLTEVIMPGLSGIGLLCKIMSHKTRKNVPVIMMSTHDSMGLVFKCLSKGAVDFLVKPIRKNELKNLWQHVWRRCHSSSGSGSESGTQTQKSVKSKSFEKSENDAGSNDDNDNGSIGLNVGDGSDDGSGTQSSWTKQAVEVDSPRPVSAWDQVAECPGSTSAQVIHSNAEQTSNKWVPLSAAKECQEQDERLVLFPDNAAMGKELEITVPRKINSQLESPDEVAIKLADAKQNNLHETGSSKFNEQIDGQLDLNSESPSSKIKPEAANLIGAITKAIHLQDSICYETPNRLSKTLDINNNAISDAKELPCLELGKRFRRTKETGTMARDDRNVLRRSDSSAFSRYNTVSNANTARSGNIGCNSPIDNCSGAMKKGSVCNIRSHSKGDPPNQCSNIGTSNIDMGSTTNNAFNKPVALRNKSAASCTVKCSSFQPRAPQQVVSDNADDIVATRVMGQARGAHQEFQIQRLPHHHFVQHKQRELQQEPCGHDDLSLGQKALVAPHFESSSILGGAVEVNAGNCSVNGSASGSNHGSSTAANAGGRNIECDNAGRSGSDDARRSGNGDASGSRSGNRWDINKFSRREAALTKFRQKRKERCFRKKVRYQSRKKLAEQRPRVRGQFVRQMPNENTSGGTDS